MRRIALPFRLPRRASPLFRSVLALVLVCAQLFAAAHALSHVGEGLAERRGAGALAATPATTGETSPGGLPAAERHERCLLCLAAADLAFVLPPSPAVLVVETLPPAQLAEPAVVLVARRAPCPPCRGPPASV